MNDLQYWYGRYKKEVKKSKQVTSIKNSQIKESYFNDDSIMMTLFTTWLF
jgi:hypothetical protein